jgi:hypothetical protein
LTPAPESAGPDYECRPGHELTGAAYDITKSKFAFGGQPTESDEGPNKRWSGPQGELLILPFGAEASANANAPSTMAAVWPGESSALEKHVTDYFAAMGLARCQISSVGVFPTLRNETLIARDVSIGRAIDGIAVAPSMANARFNADDLTVSETLTWPTIPAAVVSAARAFRTELASPSGLAAYQSKLPDVARGKGDVLILHSSPLAGSMKAIVAWSTVEDGSPVTFDTDGKPVSALDL